MIPPVTFWLMESKKWVGKYSLGMRQRLGIAQAIMEDPSLLILHEPMNGLDKHGVEDVRQLLLKLKEERKTIVIASHSSEDIDRLPSNPPDSVLRMCPKYLFLFSVGVFK